MHSRGMKDVISSETNVCVHWHRVRWKDGDSIQPALRFRNLMEWKSFLESKSEMFKRWCPSPYNYSESHLKQLTSTNVLERFNLEFKRRTKKIGAFLSYQSLLRLVVTIMMGTNEA